MVYIVSGAVNEGKTCKMASIYKQLNQGDGFISKKIFRDQEHKDFIGYEIVRLATGESRALAYKSANVPAQWDEIHCCGPFHFSKAAVEFAQSIIDDIVGQNIDPIFIDEIGPLELTGCGFASVLKRVLKTPKNIYITVRNYCVDEVIKKFNIRDYRLIKVSERNEKPNSIYIKRH